MIFKNDHMMMTCIHCANVMKMEDPKVPLRCGAEYFAQPAIIRQAQRLDRYRPVDRKRPAIPSRFPMSTLA